MLPICVRSYSASVLQEMVVTSACSKLCCYLMGCFTTQSAAGLYSIEWWDDRIIGHDSEINVYILIAVLAFV